MSDTALRQALSYRRFTGAPRILVFDSTYYVIRDVVEAAVDLGCAVFTLPARGKGRGDDRFIEELLLALCAHRPDFVFTVNHLGFDDQGVLAGLLSRFEIPLASWFVDHPLPILGGSPGNVTPHTQLFCIERTALPWLRGQGYRDPEYLPTAAARMCHPSRIDAELAAGLGTPLCWVGDSWWRKGWEEPPPWVREAATRLREEAGGLTKEYVRDRLAADLLARAAAAGPEVAGVGGGGPGGVYLVALTALAQAASAERVALARALHPLGLRVFGDAHWARLVPGLDLRPPVDARTTTPVIFAGSEVNVNRTAVHMPTANNQRVWDVPGAGGFLLTDAQEDTLLHFREGTEVAVYRDPDDAADRARHFLSHPTERAAIAAAGRARVDREHRYPHRVRRLVDIMRARFA